MFVDEDIGLHDLSRSLRCNVEMIVTLVHEGVLDPLGESPADRHLAGAALQRARRAADARPGHQPAGRGAAALPLVLMDEIRRLEAALALNAEDSNASS